MGWTTPTGRCSIDPLTIATTAGKLASTVGSITAALGRHQARKVTEVAAALLTEVGDLMEVDDEAAQCELDARLADATDDVVAAVADIVRAHAAAVDPAALPSMARLGIAYLWRKLPADGFYKRALAMLSAADAAELAEAGAVLTFVAAAAGEHGLDHSAECPPKSRSGS